jgi:recombination protein RecR
MQLPSSLQTLIATLRRLPGVGQRTAERYAFQLLEWPLEQQQQLAQAVSQLHTSIQHCTACGCFSEHPLCPICSSTQRNRAVLCVVGQARDVFAFEQTRAFDGLYHVLGGLLSPMERRGPDSIGIDRLKERIGLLQVTEVILALDTTLEGDATALFLKRELELVGCQVSRLAFGLPMGSALEYVDGGTLSRALAGRQQFV